MKEDIEGGSRIGDFVDEVLELLSGAGDRGREDLAGLRERVQDSAQRLKDGALKAEDYAHENPWHVAAMAAAVGLVLGVLISRR